SLKPLTSPHPRHDLPVIKPDDKFHSHQHLTAHAFHNPDDVRILAARGHKIDETHSTAFGFDFRFEDQRITAITPTRRFNFFVRKKPPVSVFRIAQKRGKTRRGIEPGKTEPINAPVPAHQRGGLRIAKKRVVLDLCELLRHLVLLLPPRRRSGTSRAVLPGPRDEGGLIDSPRIRERRDSIPR